MIVFPNAKINLGLNILSKRPDGFHEIETVMYPIALQDILEITPAKETTLQVSGIAMSDCPMEQNLVYKAWELLHKKYNISPVEMLLHKKIPHGAGLGGGSSDAAFTIKALNDIFGLELGSATMQELAAELGSDCPMFIDNKPVLAKGRGELLSPVDISLQGMFLALITPPVYISTATAYSGVTPKKMPITLECIIENDIETWKKLLVNDFEISIFKQHAELERLKAEFYLNGAIYASMSGSGSSIYGIFSERPTKIHKNSLLIEL